MPDSPERWSRAELERLATVQEKQLEFRVRQLGDEAPGTLEAKDRLAATLALLGDLQRAGDLRTETLEARSRVQGETHPATMQTARGLMLVRANQRDEAAMRSVFDRHLAWLLEATDDELSETLISLRDWIRDLPPDAMLLDDR